MTTAYIENYLFILLQIEPEIVAKKQIAIPIAKTKYSPVLKKYSKPTIVMPRARTVIIVLANMLIPKIVF